MQRPVYLDHHATTPMDPHVIEVVVASLRETFGNANSVEHSFGLAAAGAVDVARRQVAALVDVDPADVRFTSGSSEAIRLALVLAAGRAGGRRLRIAAMRVEHPAVLETIGQLARDGRAQVCWLDCDNEARLNMESLRRALTGAIDLVCLMAANNEVGTIYPVSRVAEMVTAAGAQLLVDATQAAGRIPLNGMTSQVDYVAISGHKIYGPKGVGALIGPGVRSAASDELLGHTGTPNVPSIIGFGVACEVALAEMDRECAHVSALRDALQNRLLETVPNLTVNGDLANRLPHNLHVSALGATSEAVLARLEGKVAISSGSACASGAPGPSHVLRAMRLAPELQESALRISPGRFSSMADMLYAGEVIAGAIQTVREASRERIAC